MADRRTIIIEERPIEGMEPEHVIRVEIWHSNGRYVLSANYWHIPPKTPGEHFSEESCWPMSARSKTITTGRFSAKRLRELVDIAKGSDDVEEIVQSALEANAEHLNPQAVA